MMYSWLVLIISFVYSFLPAVESKLPDLSTLCPYTDFCTKNATKTLPANGTDLIPCCQKCSCEPDCQLFGNCCPDKELKPDVQVKYPCVSVDSYYNAPRGIKAKSQIKISYHVINDCPTIISSYKYQRCSLPSDLEDYVFVSDPETGRIYQNKHCAMCHGVQHYTEWLIVTDCPVQSEGRTRDEWFSHVSTYCEITPIPPDSEAGKAFKCYTPKPSQHIKTCESQETNKEIKDACEIDNAQVSNMFIDKYHTAKFTMGYFTYENAFCKLCNTGVDEEIRELCIEVQSESLSKHGSSFSVIINYFKSEETFLAQKCKEGQIWDPFKTTCIDVTCPSSSIFVAGKCEDMFRRFKVPSTDVYSVILRIEAEITANLMRQNIHNDLRLAVAEILNNLTCLPCETSIITNGHEHFYFQYIMKTTPDCSSEFLKSLIQIWLESPLKIYSVSALPNITLVPELDMSMYATFPVEGPIFLNECPSATHINRKWIDPCPRVPLSYANISTATVETERNNTICVDEYFKIMRAMNLSNVSRQSYWMIVFVMIIGFNAIW